MAYELVLYPDPVLRQVAEPVEDFGPEFQELIRGMMRVLFSTEGVGLAAPQVGVSKRVCIIHPGLIPENPGKGGTLVLANPKVVKSEGEMVRTQGCLSLQGLYYDVPCARDIEVAYQDRKGVERLLRAPGGMLSVCIQHELDHLDGVLFIDKLTPLEKERALREWDHLRENWTRLKKEEV
jgi:peptide deformylase